MTFAQAATKAIELGGKFDGHELPKDINAFTKGSATALAGRGLMGVAKDSYGRSGTSKSYVAGFAEVEVDVETGVYRILDFLAVADVGTVLHPRNLGGQILGGVMLGIGHARGQKWVYDTHYGVPLAKRFYQTNRRRSSMRRRRCNGKRWILRILKRRSARVVSANHRSAPGSALWSTRSPMRSAMRFSAARR